AVALHGGRGKFEVRIVSGKPVEISEAERVHLEIEDARGELADRESELPKGCLPIAESLTSLARLDLTVGRNSEARPLFERALAIREEILGREHPDTAASLIDLAQVLRTSGNPSSARPLLERALAIEERALGPDDIALERSLTSLALSYLNEKKYSE